MKHEWTKKMNRKVVRESIVKMGFFTYTLSLFNDGTLQLSHKNNTKTLSLRNEPSITCSDTGLFLVINWHGEEWKLKCTSKEEVEEWLDQIRCMMKELSERNITEVDINNELGILNDSTEKVHPLLVLLQHREVSDYDRTLVTLKLNILETSTNRTRRKKARSELLRKLGALVDIVPAVRPYHDEYSFAATRETIMELNAMKQTIIDYFKETVGVDAIPSSNEFQEKQNGLQRGCIVTINGKKYYIKTHSRGATRSSILIRSVVAVDIKEVFVYKLLELCNIGPKVQFCKRSEKEFYIITEDLSQSESEPFIIFDDCEQDEGFVQEISILTNMTDESKLDATLLQMINTATMCDLLSRILFLTDTLGNSENFGFVNGECKLCDFTVMGLPGYSLLENEEELMTSFFLGNSKYKYNSGHQFIKYISCGRSKWERVKGLRLGLEKMLKGETLEFVIKKAYDYTLLHFEDCIGETDYFEEYYNFVQDRAKRYLNAISKFEPGQV